MKLNPQATRLIIVAAGYCPAVIAAVLVAVAIMLAPTSLPDGGANGSLFATVTELFPAALLIGLFYTFVCAWPGFIVAIWLGERSAWTGPRRYAYAGFVNVVPSLFMFAIFFGSPFSNPLMVASSFPGGLVGGAVYWWVAGRFVAALRTPSLKEAA